MKKFLPLLLCLLLSIFTMARATKPTRIAVPNMKTAHNVPRQQEADAKTLLNDANSGQEVASDDDGEDVNDDGGGDAPGDEDTGDDHAGDDDGDDDGSGDEEG